MRRLHGTCFYQRKMFKVWLIRSPAKHTCWIRTMLKVCTCMWVQQHCNMVFFYCNSNVIVDGEFIRYNMPFTIGIQDKWQWKMMLMHDRVVFVDATFGVNGKKSMATNIIINAIHSMLSCISFVFFQRILLTILIAFFILVF